MSSSSLTVGSRVKYRATFCRSIGAYTGAIPFARGTIVAPDFETMPHIVSVRWDNDYAREVPQRVNVNNLIGAEVIEHA